ncbi:hypothetical protein GPECTOR_2g1398 [Gonium pectorale]|uniref:Uncharacterized protein n=1 Tax=Gonium pectorale TaxID=33097 RepID=A0A150H111_GONPE|nr:hypothetical protein GPECTOR_2g1398 [Gonium pectorale]|eukprot:KXZ55847.1 hypothetical protein GPECTOR_2g1398 [Gonium pectorale]
MASSNQRHETSLEDVLQALCARGRDVLLDNLQAPVTGDQRNGGDVPLAALAALAAPRLACRALRGFIDGSIASVALRLGAATEALLDIGPPPLHRWPLARQVTLVAPPGEWLNNARAAKLLPGLFSHVPLADRHRITALEVGVDGMPFWYQADGAEAVARAIRELPALRCARLWPELPPNPRDQRPVVEALASLRELEDLTLCAVPGRDLLQLLRADRLRRLNLRLASNGSISAAAPSLVAVAASLRCMRRLEELTLREPYDMAAVATAVAGLPPSLTALHVKDTRIFGFESEHIRFLSHRVTFEVEGGAAVGVRAECLDLGALAELRQRCGAFLRQLRRIRVTRELAFGSDWGCQRRPYPPLDDDDLPAVSAGANGSPEAQMLGSLLRQRDLTLKARAVYVISAVVPVDLVREVLSRVTGMERLSLALQVDHRPEDWEPPVIEHKLCVGISARALAAATCRQTQPSEGVASVAGGGGPVGSCGVAQAGAASPPALALLLYDLAVEQSRAEAAEDCSSHVAPPTPPPHLPPLEDRIYTIAFVRCLNKAAQRVMDGWGPAADWTRQQRLDWLLGQWAALRVELEGTESEEYFYVDEDQQEYDSDWDQDSYGMSD